MEGWLITEAFKKLPQEKQDSILKAAMSEFARNGYKRTSTNQIVKAAGIGKGMLFYYFENKLELYNDLVAYAYEFVKQYMEQAVAAAEHNPDVIQYLQMATRIKMEAMLINPDAFNFMTRLFLHPEELEVSDEAKQQYGKMIALRDSVMQNVFSSPDTSALRRDIPADRLVRYIQWGFDGYVQTLIAKIQNLPAQTLSDMDLKPYWAEFDEYLNDLKTIFYA